MVDRVSRRRLEAAIDLACPSCRVTLTVMDADERVCLACKGTYRREAGIWRMLGQGRLEAFRTFIDQYESVREAEGRSVQDADHLRALPFRDPSRKRKAEWAIRARSYEALVRHVMQPLETRSGRPLRVLDLGSGLGWLAYRLALRGHDVAAVDLLTNDFDGLGVYRHYDRGFQPVQAEFDRLPYGDASVDLAVYGASLHYAGDYASTLRETLRALAPDGRIVILDTPIYRSSATGIRRVRERDAAFEAQFGFREDGLRSEGFLTYDRLDRLASELALEWQLVEPWYGVRWWLKPLVARLRGSGEPARFKVIVGRRLP